MARPEGKKIRLQTLVALTPDTLLKGVATVFRKAPRPQSTALQQGGLTGANYPPSLDDGVHAKLCLSSWTVIGWTSEAT